MPIEGDHVAGRNHDDSLIAQLCRRCHEGVTESRRRANADMRKQESKQLEVKQALRATAVFLEQLAEHVDKWSEKL